MRTDLLSTGQLVSRLNAAGLPVTANMLKQDVRDGYLAHRIPGPAREPGREWDRGAVRRAFHLYRLRKLDLRGDLLRLYLFLRDGWGWEYVQPVCLAGVRKSIHVQESPVRRRARTVTPLGLQTLLEEFDLAHDAALHPQIASFIWGMGFFGTPLPGGTLRPLYQGLRTELGVEIDMADVAAAEAIVSQLGLTWTVVERMVSEADADVANVARRYALEMIHKLRRAIVRRSRREAAENADHAMSTNTLSFFALPRAELARFYRNLPQRVTPAQMLGCFVMGGLPLAYLERFAALAETILPGLPAGTSQAKDTIGEARR